MRLRLRHEQLQKLVHGGRISQNHWAIRLGLSKGHWSDLLNGRHPYPSARTRELILEAFGQPLEALFEVETAAPALPEAAVSGGLGGRYLLDALIGQGGMGSVYRARDSVLARVVAVKVISEEAVAGIGARRFLAEIQRLLSLQHPNILPVFDAGRAGESPYYVMPLVTTGNLRQRLDASGPLDPPLATEVIRGVARALDYAHTHRILHCDVKPANILLDGDHPFLLDFGLARAIHGESADADYRPELDVGAGTPAYVSPEQALGRLDLDPRADVYSLACVAYEALTGKPPFAGATTTAVVRARLDGPVPRIRALRPELPASLDELLAGAMSVDRAFRPNSPGEFAGALTRALPGAGGAIHPPPTVRASPAPSRAPGPSRLLESLVRNIRIAWRSLRRTPAVTAGALACLTLGLGVTTAVFSVVSSTLLRSLPVDRPDQLVSLWSTIGEANGVTTAPANYLDWRAQNRALSGLAAVNFAYRNLEGDGDAERLSIGMMPSDGFRIIGVQAAHGRLFAPGDDDPAANQVVVLSDALWRRRFGADPAVLGRTITLSGIPATVIGVLPRGFTIPHGGSRLDADAWLTLRLTPAAASSRTATYLFVFGRRRDGVSLDQARADLNQVMVTMVAANPELQGWGVRLEDMQEAMRGDLRLPVLLLFAAVGFVLLVACGNVASLLLARGAARHREVALQVALGASIRQVVRQLLTEYGLLALAGAIGGLALAAQLMRIGRGAGAAAIPELAEVRLDPGIVAFGLGLALLTVLIFGLVPAWRAARVDPQEAIGRAGARRQSRALRRGLNALVATQVALSCMLVVGAALAVRGFLGLTSGDPGFAADRVLSIKISASRARYPGTQGWQRLALPAIAAARAVPGVEAVGVISHLPYESWGSGTSSIAYEGRPAPDPTRPQWTEVRHVSSGYRDAMGIPLEAGRDFASAEELDGPPVVMINRALARRDFPGEDPIGRRLRVNDTAFATIVGVVGDIRNSGPTSEPVPELIYPFPQGGPATQFNLMVRASRPAAVAEAVMETVRAVDRETPMYAALPMRDVMGRSLGGPRFYATLLGAAAVVALLLALLGLAGLMTYLVTLRNRELGIRMAIGAAPVQLLRMVTGDGLRLVAWGLVAGLIGAVASTRLLSGFLYGVDPLDPTVFAAMAAAILCAGLVAVWLPARRAARVDPVRSIRAE